MAIGSWLIVGCPNLEPIKLHVKPKKGSFKLGNGQYLSYLETLYGCAPNTGPGFRCRLNDAEGRAFARGNGTYMLEVTGDDPDNIWQVAQMLQEELGVIELSSSR